MTLTREAIVREARAWIGTRFVHQASVKGVGCDCIGLVAGVAGALHMPEAQAWLKDVRRMSYTREPEPKMLLEAASAYLIEIPISDLRVGDIPLMRVRNGGKPQHFGILSAYSTQRYLIHAYAQARRVVENGFSGWAALTLRAYRYRALA